jgi:hydroxymethylpyrimidine pyrophosphatase-like HAD family hydrolase
MAKTEIDIPDPSKVHKEIHIALDFDGTIAEYESWEKQGHKVGKPIKPMVDNVKRWLKKGYKVSIFTARLSHSRVESEQAIRLIEQFLEENGLPILQITCMKMYYFTHFIDDKAYHAELNQGWIEGKTGL